MKEIKNILLGLIFFLGLSNQMTFAQVLTIKDFENIISDDEIDINLFVGKNFKLKYSGPRKEGGIITHLQNQKENELLFVYADDNGNFQQLNYYLPTKEKHLKLFQSLESVNIKSTKNGKTIENGKIYYQIILNNE